MQPTPKSCGLFPGAARWQGDYLLSSINMDTRTPEKRSEIMSLVRGKNTTPELAVRRLVHGLGFRFRLHAADLPGRPDLVFPRLRKVIFVHGCFWHGHRKCSKSRLPKSRTAYWKAKLDANKARDTRNLADIRALGWGSLVVWQCELKAQAKLVTKIDRFLSKGTVLQKMKKGEQ